MLKLISYPLKKETISLIKIAELSIEILLLKLEESSFPLVKTTDNWNGVKVIPTHIAKTNRVCHGENERNAR